MADSYYYVREREVYRSSFMDSTTVYDVRRSPSDEYVAETDEPEIAVRIAHALNQLEGLI